LASSTAGGAGVVAVGSLYVRTPPGYVSRTLAVFCDICNYIIVQSAATQTALISLPLALGQTQLIL